ncbi:MAG: phosphotransferase family protein [Deltaproteobacteria bacterium]|nr:phosphotransferase family protein [Deltaproteobacteria bacterium]MBW2385896.1 phosphotransferase family protein [Deltaproteobacteria bacterium]MBW2695432.1 phosphotransferase family protein [Deltaproteobacteria bacterium]
MSGREEVAEINDKLRGWLQKRLHDVQELELTDFESPKIGYSSTTLLFDLRYRRRGKTTTEPLVLRMEPQGIPLFSHYDLRPQYRIMKTLAGSDVPVPRVRWFEDDRSVLGSPFYIMDQVAGHVPTDNPPYHVEGWLMDQEPELRRAIWLGGVAAMAKIHRLNYRDFDLAFLDEPDLGPTPIEQHINLYEQHIDWGLERQRFPLLDVALSWLRDNLPANEPTALTWGDARISNLIFQGGDCVAVLDWEMARLGNPVQDIALWLVMDRCLSEGIGVARLEGLPDESETLSHWERISGHRAEARELLFYKIFSAFCFTFVMARVMTREKKRGTMPAESSYDVDNLASQALVKLLERAGTSG